MEIQVEQPDLPAMVPKGKREVDRHRGFPDTPLPAEHKNDMFYINRCFPGLRRGKAALVCRRACVAVFIAGSRLFLYRFVTHIITVWNIPAPGKTEPSIRRDMVLWLKIVRG
jgi:hypothetical protein